MKWDSFCSFLFERTAIHELPRDSSPTTSVTLTEASCFRKAYTNTITVSTVSIGHFHSGPTDNVSWDWNTTLTLTLWLLLTPGSSCVCNIVISGSISDVSCLQCSTLSGSHFVMLTQSLCSVLTDALIVTHNESQFYFFYFDLLDLKTWSEPDWMNESEDCKAAASDWDFSRSELLLQSRITSEETEKSFHRALSDVQFYYWTISTSLCIR